MEITIDDLHVDCPKSNESQWMASCMSCMSYTTGVIGSGLPGASKKVTCQFPKEQEQHHIPVKENHVECPYEAREHVITICVQRCWSLTKVTNNASRCNRVVICRTNQARNIPLTC